ncbi:hypothetical protein [Bacillus sp. 1P06AnD]|uniref:hypothetical protein n=1 Tax=Bacillus sp. 1P06AnD TaxID=3132208 RepID=UPI0039A0EF30
MVDLYKLTDLEGKEGETMEDIHRIYVSRTKQNYFVTTKSINTVQLWSIEDRSHFLTIETNLDDGAERMLVLDLDIPIIVTGNYYGGVHAYNGFTGECLWKRADLTNVQKLVEMPGDHGAYFGIGFSYGTFLIIDVNTGETKESLTDIFKLSFSRFNPIALAIPNEEADDKRPMLVSTDDWIIQWDCDEESIFVLDAAFSRDHVMISWLGGPLQCYTLEGKKKWTISNKNGHFIQVRWNDGLKMWIGLYSMTANESPDLLLVGFDNMGETKLKKLVESPGDAYLFSDGTHLVTAKGQVIETSSGRVVWTYAAE